MTPPKTIDQKLDAILLILNGNGKIGVCAKVNIMWSVGMFVVISVAGLLLKAFIE